MHRQILNLPHLNPSSIKRIDILLGWPDCNIHRDCMEFVMNILLVEDDVNINDLLKEALTRGGGFYGGDEDAGCTYQ